MLVRALDELFWALRRAGLSISTAQAIDAARAAMLVGFADRRALRDAIGAVVVDRRADLPAYGAAFDAFFAADAHAGDLWSRLGARGFSREELSAVRDLLEAARERSGDAAVAFSGGAGDLQHLLAAAGMRRALAPMTSPLQAGFFTHELMGRLGVPALASTLARLRQVLKEALGDARGEALADALAEELEAMRRRVRGHVEAELARRVAEPEQGARRRLADAPFVALSDRELDEVRRAVRELAQRLEGGERVRRRRSRRGRVDPHRTLRASLRTGGVPFHLVRKQRRRDKPRLFVLCDVSDSVRTAALFLLELVAVAQSLFSGTRSFAFVSDIGETTRLFTTLPVETALARVHGGAVVSPAHNSNYGRVLAAFEARWGRDVDRRSTIVILGDGRTNYLADGADVLSRLRDRARAVVWICPEGRGSWGSGDSAMARYERVVSKVLVARTARELEEAAREVVARRK